ncbi:MAG: hypothetical protein L0H53_12930 [Candidatus Nitrosocosmicus sp.]|nr:hypothetical protein [Candidatus Nitrosocosmicus sp.]MDN5867610.1 hypothetical protein [Candidatus Nitrosocosmicus sp.]
MVQRNSNNTNNSNNNGVKSYEQYNLNDINYRILVSGEQTKGKYSIIEGIFPAEQEAEIPMHVRSKENVLIYIIEGKFLFRYQKEDITGNGGSVLKFDKNIPLSYRKVDEKEGKLLFLYSPAGFENFFKDLGKLNISNFKMLSGGDPILLQLLENNYGWRFVFEEN